jgi:hypothetical protein
MPASAQVHRLLEDDLAERKEHGRRPFIATSKHILNPLSLWVRAVLLSHHPAKQLILVRIAEHAATSSTQACMVMATSSSSP